MDDVTGDGTGRPSHGRLLGTTVMIAKGGLPTVVASPVRTTSVRRRGGMQQQASISTRFAAPVICRTGVVAARLWTETAYAGPPTCTERQFDEAAKLSKAQADCPGLLTDKGRAVDVCSRGVNHYNAQLARCQAARDQCATDLPACNDGFARDVVNNVHDL